MEQLRARRPVVALAALAACLFSLTSLNAAATPIADREASLFKERYGLVAAPTVDFRGFAFRDASADASYHGSVKGLLSKELPAAPAQKVLPRRFKQFIALVCVPPETRPQFVTDPIITRAPTGANRRDGRIFVGRIETRLVSTAEGPAQDVYVAPSGDYLSKPLGGASVSGVAPGSGRRHFADARVVAGPTFPADCFGVLTDGFSDVAIEEEVEEAIDAPVLIDHFSEPGLRRFTRVTQSRPRNGGGDDDDGDDEEEEEREDDDDRDDDEEEEDIPAAPVPAAFLFLGLGLWWLRRARLAA